MTEAPIVESLPPVEHVVLGSLATGSPYTMAVYLTNEGAGVERIELSEARYADREDRSGYLGFLAMNYADAGCRIQTVAPGSPAAVAKNATPGSPDGLLVGDEIVSVDKKPVATPIELDRILEKTRPGESVSLGIRRTENGDVREIEFLAPLIRRPLAIVQSNRGDELPLAQNGSTSFQMTISQLDHASVPFGKDELANLPSLLNGRWSTHRIDDHSVEFRRNLTSQDLRRIGLSGKFEIVKRYRLAENPVDERASGDPQKYHLELDIEIHNRSTEAHRIAWRLDGANGVPTEGWWYLMKTHPRSWGAAGARDVIYREANGLHQMLTSASIIKQAEDKNSPETTVTAGAANLEYIGVDTQYFSIVLQSVAPTDAVLSAAGTPSVTGFTVSRAVARLAQPVDPQHKRVANTTCR
ncbi:MAG: PDZ domain-containing protein, partial [Planctomycetota bacterium]|nr:PDZ domain-containing protein [Planctomycetota bacterium]